MNNAKKEKSSIYYDKTGDMLEIFIGKPTDSYYEELDNGIFIGKDEKTGKIIGFKIFAFKKRLIKLNFHDIPLEEPPLRL